MPSNEKKKPSGVLAKAHAKKQTQLKLVTEKLRAGPGSRPATRPKQTRLPISKKPEGGALAKLKARKDPTAASSVALASVMTARGSSSAGNSKGALVKLRTRKRDASSSRFGTSLRVGQRVVCTWRYGEAYGGRTVRFVGELVEVWPSKTGEGDFVRIVDDNGTMLLHYTKICKVKAVV